MLEKKTLLLSHLAGKKQHTYTLLGCLAIFFWATLPLISVFLQTLPTFEILTIAFFVGCLLTLSRLHLNNEWKKLNQPLVVFLIGGVSILGNDALFITAIKFAPSEQVTLLFYTWPIFVMIIPYFFSTGEKFTLKYIFTCGLGFSGIYIALTNGLNLTFNFTYFFGYSLALGSALSWSFYTLTSRYYKTLPHEIVGIYLGIAAIFAAFLHLLLEKNRAPTLPQWIILIIMGLTTEGFAYILWDCGIKKGDNRFLYHLAYCNPLIGIGLLILFKQTVFTIGYFFACLLVIASNIIGGTIKN